MVLFWVISHEMTQMHIYVGTSILYTVNLYTLNGGATLNALPAAAHDGRQGRDFASQLRNDLSTGRQNPVPAGRHAPLLEGRSK